MKNLRNNIAKLLKLSTSFTLLLLLTLSAAYASPLNDGEKGKEKVNAKDSVLMEELIADLEWEEELDIPTITNAESFKVYDANDDVIFSGTKKQWENKKDRNLTMIKRKAEFLFESLGTKIYKVF